MCRTQDATDECIRGMSYLGTYLFNGFCLDQAELFVFLRNVKGKFDVRIAAGTESVDESQAFHRCSESSIQLSHQKYVQIASQTRTL